jgi:TIMELESS-interacting protein
VEDLGNLIKLYADWHSRLIPYYSFEQFVRKVEKVGASNRVRVSFFFFPMLLQVN